ncbi:MAG: ATP-binding cassette domain-containing protein, partial [Acidimicrobiia bacterium]|nr:ATP-binding cassette domain-containing protein [Acidimicrobiia bacterium]
SNGFAIRTEGLRRAFGDFVAVDGVDLEVHKGELFSLLGPNGAGKTTTISMLCCLLRPSGGQAWVMGHDVTSDPIAVKRIIDISPQETAIASHLDAWENLSLMAGLHGMDTATTKTRSGELLEMMALTDRADEKVGKYSGGMKRRLSIAMALVTGPQVLFLDEPTLGLDPQSRRIIWEYIETLKGDTTILLTTHYLEEADALADRVAVIDHGKVIALGTPLELKSGLAGNAVMVIESPDLTDAGLDALRSKWPSARAVGGGVEIEDDEVSLYDVQDVLRPMGITITSSYTKSVTLDDVFLQLTGKQLRQ